MQNITYSDLKKQIAYNVATNERHRDKLNSLKEFFRADINSPRQYEKIKTISELLRVIETRDVLSENAIQPLKEIAMRLPNSDELLGTIERYEWTHTRKDLPNYHVPGTVFGQERLLSNYNKFPTDIFNNGISSMKKQRIYEAVIENIGPFWCTLGRKLKIRECVIDEINKNGDRYVKAAKLMELYEQKADPQNWFINLCHALDEAKMEMLRKKIQNIMMMNI